MVILNGGTMVIKKMFFCLGPPWSSNLEKTYPDWWFLKDMGCGWKNGEKKPDFLAYFKKQYPFLLLDVKMNAVYPEQKQRHDSGA